MNKNRIYEQLKLDEGIKYEIYKDHLGFLTVGVGHLILKEDEEYSRPIGTVIQEKRAMVLFEKDLSKAVSECYKLYTDDFDDFPGEVQEILVNMMFNLGRPRLSKFKNMNAAIHKGFWKEAAKEGRDSNWYRQVTARAERLMVRLENV